MVCTIYVKSEINLHFWSANLKLSRNIDPILVRRNSSHNLLFDRQSEDQETDAIFALRSPFLSLFFLNYNTLASFPHPLALSSQNSLETEFGKEYHPDH
ncbi:unnamed protein product [Rhodiola kirilowii]